MQEHFAATPEDYVASLRSLRLAPTGYIETLVTCPAIDRHEACGELAVVPGEGVVGQYPGKQWWRGRRMPGRQVSVVSADVLDSLEIGYTVTGDNIVVRGIDLALFQPGDFVRIGSAVFVVTPTAHRPCKKLARRSSEVKVAAISQDRFRGIFLDACEPSVVRRGDIMERLLIGPCASAGRPATPDQSPR